VVAPVAAHQGPHVVVVANGEFAYPQRLEEALDAADTIIAADGAAAWLVAHGRPPHLLVGDMDSIAPALAERLADSGCRLVHHPTHKDETDTELALYEAVALGARRITLLGALGGRIDHAMANIMLLLMPVLTGIETTIYDGQSRLFLIRGDAPSPGATIAGAPGDVLSLIPLGGDAEGVRTEGLEYPLRDETLAFGPARGVSNVFLGTRARVTLRHGILLAVHTPRRHVEEGVE
jgi:thiamine pyrophosphokinase